MFLDKVIKQTSWSILAVHVVVLAILLLLALFVSVTVKGPTFIPDGFFKEQFIESLVANLAFFYCVYLFIPKIKEYKSVALAVTFSLIFVGAAVSFSVWFDFFRLEKCFEFPSSLSRYLIFINIISKCFYGSCAIITHVFTRLIIQKRYYNQLRLSTAQAELSILKSQTEPHFLFNVLNTLYASAYKYGDTATADGIGQLSGLMRYTLHNNHQAKVTLSQEVDYIEQYLALQKLRFQHHVLITFDCQNIDRNTTIAPMLFMPLIENAFKYGVLSGISCEVAISLYQQERMLCCCVTNSDHSNQVKSSDQFAESGFGLDNLKQRLSALYDNHFVFECGSVNGIYTARLKLT